MTEKRRSGWDDLLESVRVDDGLPVRDSGYWAKEKLWYWNRYLEITTKAMVGNPAFPGGLIYVDMFSGPGVCAIHESSDRFPGSPLIAAGTPKKFTKILLCEMDPNLATACEQRLKNRGLTQNQFQVFRGDCNREVAAIAQAIPPKSLTLAFLDPTGLHLHFDSVSTLTQNRRVDLLILFPDRMDIIRNEGLYFEQSESNLDRFLGKGSNWRDDRQSVVTNQASSISRFFVTCYKRQLQTLGYDYSDDIPIRHPTMNQSLYRLVYASKDQRGLDFWIKSCKKSLKGEIKLF